MENDKSRAGQVAGKGTFFGPFTRFKVYPVHTRFDCVAWFVDDAETPDESGLPSVVAQADHKETAMAIALEEI